VVFKFGGEKMKKLAICIGVFSILSLSLQAMAGMTINNIEYVRHGASEALAATFTTPDGGRTTNNYSGVVEIIVSGSGESGRTQLNDAFWVYTETDHSPITPGHYPDVYQLTIGKTNLVALNSSQDAQHFIVYDADAALAVTPTYVPTYRSDHTYDIVINTSLLGTYASQIHFGVNDGNYSDNSGFYNIQIFQLQPTPEPATLALLGLGGLLLSRRKK
jgi:hypothetical protein